ncbi:MAG: twin-arginine translocase subunit TatC [Bacillota bacterium]|nr:twin-arginine translocase subunit TatC [Bacillota bacterium]
MAELTSDTIKDGALKVLNRLEEVRRRIIVTLLGVAASSAAGWYLSPRILARLTKLVPKVIYTTPAEAFLTQIELAIVIGIFLALPLILWELWAFVATFLPAAQRRKTFWVVPAAFLLFVGGASFCFFFVLPAALRFFMSFASADLRPMIQFRSLVKFAEMLIIPFGLVFEMPVVAYFLARVGILRPEPLVKNRKLALFVGAILAALITPTPDPFNMSLMLAPMYLMYELSIWIARLVWRARRARAERETAPGGE